MPRGEDKKKGRGEKKRVLVDADHTEKREKTGRKKGKHFISEFISWYEGGGAKATNVRTEYFHEERPQGKKGKGDGRRFLGRIVVTRKGIVNLTFCRSMDQNGRRNPLKGKEKGLVPPVKYCISTTKKEKRSSPPHEWEERRKGITNERGEFLDCAFYLEPGLDHTEGEGEKEAG